MIIAFDAHYREDHSVLAAVSFAAWDAPEPAHVRRWTFPPAAGYEPGKFYLRELPLILRALEEFDLEQVKAIIVDGYVYLDEQLRPGLGGHLYESLGERVPVIGVAKSYFHEAPAQQVYRGTSTRPLYVTAAGVPSAMAAENVSEMAGNYRLPDLLRILDRATKDDPEK
ncbi:endonuclease V [Lewinella sp. W8]|uniref:endonuclease V n=1 Tax=Lewinella sp. W8 TaxID=2528208 RepID=UPI0010682AE0|nr:endonuclease V [Lewinella sp. W8]MTB49598.1 endonuclease V [Lewinella sp. W8]